MEEMQQIIDDLMEEHERLYNELCMVDSESEDHKKLEQAIAQNASTIQGIKDRMKEEERKSEELHQKKVENRLTAIKIGVTVGGTLAGVLAIVLKVKGTEHILDKIYAYETEALMPNQKVNMATRILEDKTLSI